MYSSPSVFIKSESYVSCYVSIVDPSKQNGKFLYSITPIGGSDDLINRLRVDPLHLKSVCSFESTTMVIAEEVKSNGSNGAPDTTSSKASGLTRTPSAFGLYLKDDLSKAKFSTIIFSMKEKVGALSEALKIFSVSSHRLNLHRLIYDSC